MSWYRSSDGKVPKFRAAVIFTATGAGAVDIQFTLPASLDSLWTETQSDGDDLHMVDADGETKLVYDLSSWSQSSHTGTMQVDGYNAPGAGQCLVWLYYGSSDMANGEAAVTIASPKTGFIELARPGPLLFTAVREQPGAQRPRQQLAKRPNEQIHIWIDWSGILEKRLEPFQEKYLHFEEIDYISSTTVTTGGADQTDMYDASEGKVVGSFVTKHLIKAGSDGSDYTITAQIKTTKGQTLEHTVWLKVRGVDEA